LKICVVKTGRFVNQTDMIRVLSYTRGETIYTVKSRPTRRIVMKKLVHLIYRRIPNRVLERDDELIADLDEVVVAKAKFEGMLAPLKVNGIEVIRNGYTMLYFAFIGKNYDVLKVYDKNGHFKGFYIDILAYTRREGNTLEMLDLFLDIFIFPSGEAFLLDEDELEMALNYGVIDRETFDFAYTIAREIMGKIEKREFPPEIVWEYELEGLE